MLLAVEGGGFFSSSASGYSSGLALLIFGRRDDEQPIKVSPWSHYQLVEQEFEPESRLPSRKKQNSQGCTSFICFKCACAQLDGESPSKVGLVDHSETLSDSSCSDRSKVLINDAATVSERKPCLKSNLKKLSRDCSTVCEGDDPHEFLEGVENETSCCTVGRKVQWTDKCGKELVEIREFELRYVCLQILVNSIKSFVDIMLIVLASHLDHLVFVSSLSSLSLVMSNKRIRL
ncbi:hypothetical protein BHE74_00055385 [Ensete ventricosum]|nr:hypothetical protein GW17_00022812 [Ensete ventricosum]RWW39298.1 hypothetical protein BHE74_00055385 [Ensete ventricosum]RZS26242.1 hypothetical protein BHM03_00059558 [Ensete ventricosum]